MAINIFGASAPSDIVTGRTGGLAPVPPLAEDIILLNSTWIKLNLTSWDDGGCKISSFVIEYQLEDDQEPWHLVSNNVKQEEAIFPIYDLQPSTSYVVKMTAHNSAGSSAETYAFTTLDTGTVAQKLTINKKVILCRRRSSFILPQHRS